MAITVIEKNKKSRVGYEENPADIKAENINISFEGKDLFVNASLLIANGKRYGLVGSKSCGKTALLEHIANREFGIPSDLDVFYWKRENVDKKLSVKDFVVAPSKNSAKLLVEREKLKAKLKKGNCDKKVKERLAELWEKLLLIDPKGIPAKAKVEGILQGLGFSDQTKSQMIKYVPKRWRGKVSLARALFLEPSLLILDEPTTEFDIDAVLWLENYLHVWEKTLIVVSQDRCFLDNVCNQIIYVDHQKLFQYEGNYSSFELFVQNGNSSEAELKVQNGAMSKSQKQNETEIHNGEEDRVPFKKLQKPEFSFADPVDFDPRNFASYLTNVTFGYKRQKALFRRAIHSFFYNPKNAILGPSGVGKSTLLRLASGKLKPKKGKIMMRSKEIRIGVFDQKIINRLPVEQSPLEYIMRTCKSHYEEAVKQLTILGLAAASHTSKIGDLSASEKARLVLARFCLVAHDVLFLDEPTRYLDIEMIDALTDAIIRFKGGLLIVTNNEYLIREAECELCCITDKILQVEDDFDDYRKEVLKELNEPIKTPLGYKRKTPSGTDMWPLNLQSNSKIIDDYIKFNKDADPNIREIGKYTIIFEEGHDHWNCYSPTLKCSSYGKTKELCHKRMLEVIENFIELLIEDKEEVPSPP